MDQTFLIALGGNLPSTLGTPETTLAAALALLPRFGVHVEAQSRFYETPCFPAGAGPDYVNAAARVRFDGAPVALLERLHAVEAEFGRAREQRWGQRTLDLDLLAAGSLIWPDRHAFEAWRGLTPREQMQTAPDHLILPHPRLHERAFVLVPLNDVAQDWRHPILGQSVAEMLAALPEGAISEVQPL